MRDKKVGDMFTTAKRYPAEGKSLDYSTALPFNQQTGQEPTSIPEPGKPWRGWSDEATMRHKSTTNGDKRVK